MRVIAIANRKGGVGKTTTTAGLGSALGRSGYRVLVVDNDPQGSLSLLLGHGSGPFQASTWSALYEDPDKAVPFERAILPTPAFHVDLVPADPSLSMAERVLSGRTGWERRLLRTLPGQATKAGYDFVLIDCPPNVGALYYNALRAAASVIVPAVPEYLASAGVSDVLDSLGEMQRDIEYAPRVLGVLLTMIASRTAHHAEMEGAFRADLGEMVFQTVVPMSGRLKSLSARGRSVLDYRTAPVAQAYTALAKEVLDRVGQDAIAAGA